MDSESDMAYILLYASLESRHPTQTRTQQQQNNMILYPRRGVLKLQSFLSTGFANYVVCLVWDVCLLNGHMTVDLLISGSVVGLISLLSINKVHHAAATFALFQAFFPLFSC